MLKVVAKEFRANMTDDLNEWLAGLSETVGVVVRSEVTSVPYNNGPMHTLICWCDTSVRTSPSTS